MKKKKRFEGRPKMTEIHIRLTKEQLDNVKLAASSMQLSISEMIRAILENSLNRQNNCGHSMSHNVIPN